jgi:hypothetical protein
MSNIIYPRSCRETMDGWIHLPRYIDKIRLHLAGKLHPDYQPNFSKGFDGVWLELAGVDEKQFIDVVRNSITEEGGSATAPVLPPSTAGFRRRAPGNDSRDQRK